jgi:hypothetical protein
MACSFELSQLKIMYAFENLNNRKFVLFQLDITCDHDDILGIWFSVVVVSLPHTIHVRVWQ